LYRSLTMLRGICNCFDRRLLAFEPSSRNRAAEKRIVVSLRSAHGELHAAGRELGSDDLTLEPF
jgi:hypothetical protein